jgi:hypothetical protein
MPKPPKQAIIEEGSRWDFKRCVLEYIPKYRKNRAKRLKRRRW